MIEGVQRAIQLWQGEALSSPSAQDRAAYAEAATTIASNGHSLY
jgi:hypothetical protein